MNIKTTEEQCDDYFDYFKLVHAVKTISIINLQINLVMLEFGMQLSRFVDMIKTEQVDITLFCTGQTVDIKISGEYQNDVLDIASKIRAFCAANNYEAMIK